MIYCNERFFGRVDPGSPSHNYLKNDLLLIMRYVLVELTLDPLTQLSKKVSIVNNERCFGRVDPGSPSHNYLKKYL